MKLVIVESPAKAKTIQKYLGDDYVVRASVGHIRDLPKSNKNAIDMEAGFKPRYEIVPGKEKIIAELKKLAKEADEVILATDPDREGEAIAWHLAEVLDLKNPKRVEYHEITKEAIQKAFANPRTIDLKRKSAQEARRVLDRLFGYDLSGLIWKKVRYGLSAGRVQSPALRILMEREREIRAFTPITYYQLTALLSPENTQNNKPIPFVCKEEPQEKEAAERIAQAAKTHPWQVEKVEEKEVTRAPNPPFKTSTLQQAASTRLGFSPSQTMRLAQRLYEQGHITYMRTDAVTLSAQAIAQAKAYITEHFGKTYHHQVQYRTTAKAAQEAHEAIRPSDLFRTEAGSTLQEKKLYRLIWQRTIASQMSPAKLKRTTVSANITGADPLPPFIARGQRIVFDGWFAADPEAASEELTLPAFTPGDPLSLHDFATEEKQTKPPSRYTEAGLVKELEKRGIGRPSTYATILKTLIDRGYVTKEGRTLIPTALGDVVSSFLEEHFSPYISDTFTAEMENELDEIARGKRAYEPTLADFWHSFHAAVEAKESLPKLTNLGPAPKAFRCPVCGGEMVYKLSRGGVFMSCARFPECTGARKEDGTELAAPKATGEPCPVCGEGGEKPNKKNPGVLMEREGRFGRFVACSNYPKCKYVKKEASQNGTGVSCPACKEGEIVEKRGRFGTFFACSRYPDCRFSMKARPTGKTCPECGSLMMEGTKTIPERCSNKACPNHRPDRKK